MKRIFGIVLALVMLVSVFAVLPASAADEVDEGWTVLLNSGIVLNYYEGGEKVDSVSVAAKEMAVSQTVSGKTTSVEAYLNGLIEGEYGENTKALAQALLNYGAAAYDYFDAQGKCEDIPEVDGEPVTDTAALKGAEAPAVVIDDRDGIYLGATLVLDGTMKLRFYFKGETRTGTVDGTDNVSAIKKGDGNCYFDVAVMPYAICDPITVVVDNTTVTYAPINYLQAKADDAELSAMVASIYAYGVAAKTYSETDGCEHKGGIVFEITTYPTLFTEGAENKCCKICGKVLEADLPMDKTEATIIDGKDYTNDKAPNATGSIGDALGDKTFQPGNDLYLEFSILYNDTMLNVETGSAFGWGHISTNADGSNEGDCVKKFSWLAYRDGNSYCPFRGSFEFSENVKEYAYGPKWTLNGTEENYTIIQGLDGWHRIGVKYTQNYYENNGEFSYDVTATVYVDGVKTNEIVLDWGDMFYSVEVDDNGKPVYVQNDKIDDYYAVFYRIGNPSASENAYFVYADMYLTVGDGFAVNVTSVKDPAEADDFVVSDGVTLPAKQYFKVQGQSDCDVGNHTWAESATVDTEATCTTDGQKSIKCTICKEIKEDTIEVIPAGHAWGLPTVDTEATCTTEGQKSIKCTVCGDTKDGSVEVIPAGHTWAENATVDTEATCTTEGQKSIKCTVCGDTKDGSVEVIPTAGHKGIEVTTVPTVFSDGVKSGTCTVCGEFVSETLAKTEADVLDIDSSYTNNNAPNEVSDRIDSALGDKTFQPGNDLFYEFSILWNDTMSNVNGTGIGIGHIAKGTDVSKESESIIKSYTWLYHSSNAQYSPFPGGFEFSEGVKKVVYGPTWKAYNENRDDFVIIEGYGWHRIGIKYSQNYYEKEDGSFDYDVTVTLYIDGNKESELILDWGAMFYSVERKDGDLVYTQNENIEYYRIVKYRIGNPKLDSGKSHAYFVFADEYLTVGDDFVLDAVPVENPRANTFSQDGVTLDGKQYFRLKGDCDLGIHTWDAEATVDFEPTCTTDGQKSVKCSICNATNPDSIEVIKAAGQHVVPEDAEVTIIPTVFSEGLRTGVCTECGETASAPIAKTPATIINTKGMSNSKAPNATGSIAEALEKSGKTFAPGNDLYLEFSILYNDTMLNVETGSAFGWGHISTNADGYNEGDCVKKFSWLAYRDGNSYCPFRGSFEFSENVKDYVYGPKWKLNGTKENYTIIQGLDGWHRIGLQYHQNVYEDNGEFTYDVTITVYVDGAKTNEIIVDWGDMFYYAEKVNGETVYKQNKNIDDYYAVYYRIGNPKASNNAYFVFADMYLTVGDGFVLDVSSVENPEAQEFTQDGVTLSGKQYFTVNN